MPGFERMVVLAVGDECLVLVEDPAITIRPSLYGDAGLDPWPVDTVVVKASFRSCCSSPS